MKLRTNTIVLVAAALGIGALTTIPAVGSASAADAGPRLASTSQLTSPRAGLASAATDPPKGWTVTSSARTDHLVWTAPKTVLGDARVQFFQADRVLPGFPRPVRGGRAYRLDVPTGTVTDAAALQVRAGGRRLDTAGVAALSRSQGAGPTIASTPAALPPVSVDPGKRGRFATTTGTYTLPAVQLPDYPEPVEMQAVVVAPKGATGKRPLALFLHGRHSVCYGKGDLDEIWPCPAGTKSIPSYRGYLRAQRLLASQGYVTVSISANGINAQDFASDDGGAQARSSLIRLHLARWADWANTGQSTAPAVVKSAPRADLSKVLLMGHSRGGEGVNRAAIDSLTPPPSAADGYHGPVRWTIRGTLLLAPTLFGHDPQPDVPSVVVLPGCDGDVYDLQGQISVDGTSGFGTGTALHSAAFVVGANHNYFNSEWTPGLTAAPADDDWFQSKDKVCGQGAKSLRLTPVQQQRVGATYIAAAARLFVQGDDRVLPLLDGSAVQAPSVRPARVLSHAIGAARTPFVQPTADLRVTASGTTRARLCREVTKRRSSCISSTTLRTVPHFVSFNDVPEEPDRHAVALRWTKAGGSGARMLLDRPASLRTARSVALRILVPTNSPTKKFDVVIADSTGHKATLGRVSVTGLPGTAQTVGYWAQEVRVPLTVARRAKLDLDQVRRLSLIPRSSGGQAWLLDAWGWRTGTPTVRVAPATRVDVGALGTVAETDGPVTYQMPVSVSGPAGGTLRIFVTDLMSDETSTRVVTVPPGTAQIEVPVQVPGDTTYGEGNTYRVYAGALPGTVVGDYVGTLNVTEDDPLPTITVTPVADQVIEGKTLSWRLGLSEPAAVDLYLPLAFLPPTSGPELSTTDVPATWALDVLGIDGLPSRPLSATDTVLYAPVVRSGETRVEVEVPTVKDASSEGAEQIRVQVRPVDEQEPEKGPAPVELTGTVTDAP